MTVVLLMLNEQRGGGRRRRRGQYVTRAGCRNSPDERSTDTGLHALEEHQRSLSHQRPAGFLRSVKTPHTRDEYYLGLRAFTGPRLFLVTAPTEIVNDIFKKKSAKVELLAGAHAGTVSASHAPQAFGNVWMDTFTAALGFIRNC
uniref:Uncharacterized protein n=1 Tax=Knipowitschia caucasica TaxID=637954 RepID=A0AAV2JWB0_KNICA